MPEEGVGWSSHASTVLLVVFALALLFVLVRAQRARDVVGEELARERPRGVRVLRAALPVVLIVALFAWCLDAGTGEDRFEARHVEFEMLALAALVLWLAPVRADRTIGRDGLLVGGRALRWSALLDPRLEGAVLAFESNGRAERIELSPELLLAVREVLGSRRAA